MLLTIDVGNTNIEFGIFDEDTLIGSFRLRTEAQATSDELGILACEYFARFGHNPLDVEAIIIASVVPQIMHSLTNACVKYFGRAPLVVDQDIEPGLVYDSKERLGTDRAVCCVAAIEKYGKPLIVLDFGTATTIDAIGPDGTYLGGTIGTGLRVTMEALASNTAMLPRIELAMPEHIIGTSTTMQLQGGIVAGYVGNVEYLIRHMKKEMGREDAKVVATGGLSRMISAATDAIDVQDSSLILDGLRMLYRRHRS